MAMTFAPLTFAPQPASTVDRFHVRVPCAGLGSRDATRSTYLRRRVGALTFVVALVVSVGSVAQHGVADRGGDPASATAVGRAVSYVVQPGDTLWSIAERLYPGSDVTLVVDSMVSLNGGAAIDAGQRIQLP
jgi:hypothetical protein